MSTATQERIIRPARNILGTLRLPGDKSISHRYAMLGAFAEGTSRFSNFSTGADCASTLACMQALGARFASSMMAASKSTASAVASLPPITRSTAATPAPPCA